MARVYAGWGFSQAFYRQQLDISKMGYSSLEDFLVAFWEGLFLAKDANNLLAMLWTWQNGDISANALYGGDFARALGAIKAQAYVMPGRTDLYSRRRTASSRWPTCQTPSWFPSSLSGVISPAARAPIRRTSPS